MRWIMKWIEAWRSKGTVVEPAQPAVRRCSPTWEEHDHDDDDDDDLFGDPFDPMSLSYQLHSHHFNQFSPHCSLFETNGWACSMDDGWSLSMLDSSIHGSLD